MNKVMFRFLGDSDKRVVVGHMNYPTNVTKGFNPYVSVGPDTLGSSLWPVEISDDGRRVGFSYVAPEGV